MRGSSADPLRCVGTGHAFVYSSTRTDFFTVDLNSLIDLLLIRRSIFYFTRSSRPKIPMYSLGKSVTINLQLKITSGGYIRLSSVSP